MSNIKRNYLLNLAYRIFSIVFPLLSAPYISRVIGAEGIGIYSYTTSILVYFLLFAEMGATQYARVEAAKMRDNKYELGKFFSEIQIIRGITTIICLFGWIIYIYIYKEYMIYNFVLSFCILAAFFDISWLYIGLEKFPRMVARNLVVRMISFASVFIFVKSKDDLVIYFLIYALGEFFGNISYWIGLRSIIDCFQKKNLDIRKHVRNIWTYFIPSIATTIYTALDKTMLKFYTNNLAENGYYDQAVKLCNIPLTIIVSMDAVIGARMAYLIAKSQKEEIEYRLYTSIQFVLLLAFPFVFGLIAIAGQFVPWYLGSTFNEAVVLIQLYVPIILCIGINNCLSEQYLTPSGQRKRTARIVLISAFMNCVLNMIMIPKFGAKGAAIASVISEGYIAISYVVMSRKVFPIRKYIYVGWRYFVSAIIMYVFVHYISKQWEATIVCSILQVLVGAITYFVCLLLLQDKLLIGQIKNFTKNREER